MLVVVYLYVSMTCEPFRDFSYDNSYGSKTMDVLPYVTEAIISYD